MEIDLTWFLIGAAIGPWLGILTGELVFKYQRRKYWRKYWRQYQEYRDGKRNLPPWHHSNQ